MKYKKDDDNRYRVRFMRATEELMDAITVKQFISFLEENAEFEDEDTMYVGTCHNGHIVNTKVYMLRETPDLRKEFIVTEDGRVFYWLSVIQKIELVDEEPKMEVEEMQDTVDFREVKDIVKRVVAELKEQDPNWSWRAVVNKSEVKVFWGYLQHCDTKDSHFTIKMSDRPEESNTKDFMVARNEHDEYMTGAIVGDQSWSDGNIEKCVEKLLREVAGTAHSCY